MSKLKAQSNVSSVTLNKMVWPTLQLPPTDPRYGMTAAHVEALHEWYGSVQSAVDGHISKLGQEIENLKNQLNASK